MKITLPLPPNMANDVMYWHWRKKKRELDAYMLRCTAAHHQRPDRPMAPVRLNATLYMWNTMDEDNLTARLKWPIDWLVERQILLDDHPSCITLGEVRQEVDRKNQRVELEIVALADEEAA